PSWIFVSTASASCDRFRLSGLTALSLSLFRLVFPPLARTDWALPASEAGAAQLHSLLDLTRHEFPEPLAQHEWHIWIYLDEWLAWQRRSSCSCMMATPASVPFQSLVALAPMQISGESGAPTASKISRGDGHIGPHWIRSSATRKTKA
ncbi:unnamed protein product, partial [Effrenium voratum]